MNPILPNFPLPIQTPRLVLKPPHIGDGPIINAAIIESFDELHPFMPWAKTKPTVEESESWVKLAAANWIEKKNEEPYLPLFIWEKATEQCIGSTGYHHFDWNVPSIEIGYWLKTSHTGRGFMTEAVNALTQYAFKQLTVKRIAITCDVINIKSKKIPERLGYCLEGTLKNNRRTIDGKLSDTLVFARYNLNDLPNLTVTW